MRIPKTILVNRYVILKPMGAGGQGTVYQAKDQLLDRIVAIKEASFDKDDQELCQSLEHEARLLAVLKKHSTLPAVYDYFTEDDSQFLVMEYIPGDDLAQILKRRGSAFSSGEVLKWADQLLEVLDYLHNRQPPIIHRDIKPQNLKLNEQGDIILLDFGIAKDSALGTVVPGHTPLYAPLEQLQGAGTDARSDLYSLAATLYHLLTGVNPVPAMARFNVISSGQHDPMVPANGHNKQIPSFIANVITQALALNRDERPTSASEMRAILCETEHSYESTSLSTDPLIVFSTDKQKTELRATAEGLELYLYDNRPGRGGLRWKISREQVQEILLNEEILVIDKSKYKNCGLFSIGPKKNWLYSKHLYPKSMDLHTDLKKLLEEVSQLRIEGTSALHEASQRVEHSVLPIKETRDAMNKPTYIIWHTANHGKSGVDFDTTAALIDKWHKAIGWKGIGYHYVIRKDGTVEKGREELEVGAHAKGLNSQSIGICFSGHGSISAHTPAQRASGLQLTIELVLKYDIDLQNVIGHREINSLIKQGKLSPEFATKKSGPGKLVDMNEVRRELNIYLNT